MPTVVLKNFIMGNLHRPTYDSAIADSIDFIHDTVNVVVVVIIVVIVIFVKTLVLRVEKG